MLTETPRFDGDNSEPGVHERGWATKIAGDSIGPGTRAQVQQPKRGHAAAVAGRAAGPVSPRAFARDFRTL